MIRMAGAFLREFPAPRGWRWLRDPVRDTAVLLPLPLYWLGRGWQLRYFLMFRLLKRLGWLRRLAWCFLHDADGAPRPRFSDRPIIGAPFFGRTPREYAATYQLAMADGAERRYTRRSFTASIPVDAELAACVRESGGDTNAGVRLWLMRRGERAERALTARVLELHG